MFPLTQGRTDDRAPPRVQRYSIDWLIFDANPTEMSALLGTKELPLRFRLHQHGNPPSPLVGTGYTVRDLCDGQSRAPPGRWPVNFRRHPAEPSAHSKLFANICWMGQGTLRREEWDLRERHNAFEEDGRGGRCHVGRFRITRSLV